MESGNYKLLPQLKQQEYTILKEIHTLREKLMFQIAKFSHYCTCFKHQNSVFNFLILGKS